MTRALLLCKSHTVPVCPPFSALQDHFVFRSHLCISFELLAINLYDFIKHNNFCGLSMGLIRRFGHQILVSLQFLRVSTCAVHGACPCCGPLNRGADWCTPCVRASIVLLA